MHAVCLSVCLLSARCLRHISVGTPSKPVVRGSLVKNGLKIVNKNIVVNGLLVLCSPMSPINLVDSDEVAAMD